MKKTIRRLLVTGALIVGALAIATPAQADTYAHYGDRGHATVRWGSFIWACDDKVDGRSVIGQFTERYSHSIVNTPSAPSGGCTDPIRSWAPGGLDQFRVCVEGLGCSDWKRP